VVFSTALPNIYQTEYGSFSDLLRLAPVLLAIKIDDEPGQGLTPRDPALIRSRFMKGLGTGRGGALEA
jgi:hypothetical protein